MSGMRSPAAAVLAVVALATALVVPSAGSAQAAASLSAPAIQPPNGWVRREVDNWIYWVPNNRWVDTHNPNGIDISSPTGDIVVSYGWASSPVPLTTKGAIDYVLGELERTGAYADLRVVRTGPVNGAPGDETQNVFWRATGIHPEKGPRPVRGVLSVHVFTVGPGAHGFEAYLTIAPTAIWSRSTRTMEIIRSNITYIPT